jgi:glycosyltransferase involved in cell wall biosynthesis
MISILIPVYNTEVIPLINELKQQLDRLNIKGEILVFDDYSSTAFRELNNSLKSLSGVVYKELDNNYGRTAIRQLLALDAQYEWLLFLDGDSRVIHSDFLRRYMDVLQNGFDVYTGGRVYPPKPVECNKRLHWLYGSKRESAKGNTTAFHTNNFLIRKKVFGDLNFPDFLKSYGHEDTWMGIELGRMGKKILHIDNGIEHKDIEDTPTFLNKTRQALQNLLLLSKVTDKKQLEKHVSLFRTYRTIKQFHFGFSVDLLYRSFKKKIIDNLNSCNPSLFIFDLYRLYHLIQLSKMNDR